VRTLARWFAIVTVFGMAACGESTSPAPPTAPTPAPPQPPSLLRVSLSPQEIRFTDTGQSIQLMVMAMFSDGDTRNVTTEVTWQIDKPEVLSIDHGVMTSRGYGSTMVRGDYQGKFVGGAVIVPVPPERLLPLTGVVRDQYGRRVPGAQIVGISGPPLGATADANGAFDLGTTYGPVRLAASKFGYETSETAVTVAGGPVLAELTLPENPSPYVEQTFEAEGRPVWQTHRFDARAGGPLDVLVQSSNCSYRHTVGVLTVRLRSGGVLLDDEIVGCGARVRSESMPGNEAQLEVVMSTPGTYRVTYRVPR